MNHCFPFILIAGFLILSSCRDNTNQVIKEVPFQRGKITEINIEAIPDDTITLKLSDLFSDVRIIPLETKKECVIENTRIEFSEDFLFVSTQNFPNAAKLYRFDNNGIFLNEIGKDGRGPGEHTGTLADQIIPSEENKSLLVNWSGLTDNPQVFDFDGSFIEEIKQPMFLVSDIQRWSDDEWFSSGNCTGRPFYEKDSFKLFFYTKEGKITKSFPRLEYPNQNSNSYTPYGGRTQIYKLNDQWKAYIGGIDTVFTINNKELIPSEVIHPGKDGIPVNKIISPDELNGKYSIGILAETENNFILEVNKMTEVKANEYKPGRWSTEYHGENKLIVVDKKSKKANYIKLTNDLIRFIPDKYLQYRIQWKNNSNAFISLQALDYLRFIKESKDFPDPTKSIKATSDLNNINENSNPIIITFKLKNRIIIK